MATKNKKNLLGNTPFAPVGGKPPVVQAKERRGRPPVSPAMKAENEAAHKERGEEKEVGGILNELNRIFDELDAEESAERAEKMLPPRPLPPSRTARLPEGWCRETVIMHLEQFEMVRRIAYHSHHSIKDVYQRALELLHESVPDDYLEPYPDDGKW